MSSKDEHIPTHQDELQAPLIDHELGNTGFDLEGIDKPSENLSGSDGDDMEAHALVRTTTIDDTKDWSDLTWGEVWKDYIVPILMCAGPISITLAIENGETLVNLYWVGQWDTMETKKLGKAGARKGGNALGGVGMGNMWTNTMGIVAILAFNAGLQIFCSHAHGRRELYPKSTMAPKMVGIFW